MQNERDSDILGIRIPGVNPKKTRQILEVPKYERWQTGCLEGREEEERKEGKEVKKHSHKGIAQKVK